MSEQSVLIPVKDTMVFCQGVLYNAMKQTMAYFKNRKVCLSIELTDAFDPADAHLVVQRLQELGVSEVRIEPSRDFLHRPTLQRLLAMQNALDEHCTSAVQKEEKQVYTYPNMTVEFMVGVLPTLLSYCEPGTMRQP